LKKRGKNLFFISKRVCIIGDKMCQCRWYRKLANEVALLREAAQFRLMIKKLTTILFLFGSLLWAIGCHTVPQTGRSALHLVPSDQLTMMASAQFGQLKQDTPISTDPTYNAMVQRVGERIAYVAAPDMPNAHWEFVVFDDPEQINAFAMPGGKVAVYTGIFKVVQSDADLAIVMGHEVAHVAAGHGNERVSQQLLAAGGALALQFGTSDLDSEDQAMILAAYGAGATFGVMLPYSRYHESEADEIGLIYAAKAGYDPRAAIGFWERMEAQSSGSVPEFLSTHPASATRISKLNELMPKAYEIYKTR
jgi:predicted Zn-dependent protease